MRIKFLLTVMSYVAPSFCFPLLPLFFFGGVFFLDGEGAQGRPDREPRVLDHERRQPPRREAHPDPQPMGELMLLIAF